MSIELKKVVIHNLIKEVGTKATLELSKTPLSINDEKTISLGKELNDGFLRKTQYGIFDQKSMANVFPSSFISYSQNLVDFITFTKNVVSDLKSRVESVSTSKGGHIVFISYLSNGIPFLAVYIVRDKAGKNFIFKNSQVEITEVTHIDTNKLAMACRINLTSFRNNEERYLSFISTQQEETSKYFQNWIGTIKKEKDKDDSNKLRSLISHVALPLDAEGKEISRPELRRQVYGIFAVNKSDPISLRTLSEKIWKDPDVLIKYAEDNSIEINEEFTGDDEELKKLTKCSIQKDNMNFTFPPDYYGTKVCVNNTRNPKTVTITSNDFADEILKENV